MIWKILLVNIISNVAVVLDIILSLLLPCFSHLQILSSLSLSFACLASLCSDRISSGNMITFTMGPLTYNNTQSLELPEIVSQNNAKCCKIFLIETRERGFFGSCFTRYSMTFLDILNEYYSMSITMSITHISCRLKKS